MNLSPRDNFYRCMTLIVDNGNEAAWELLDFYLSNQGTTLKDFIENNQHEIYHLCYNYSRCCRCQYAIVNKPKSRILYQTQLDILLDTKGSNIPCHVYVHTKPSCTHRINDHYANPNIATNQLDLTLCRCLLINFTNILPHGSVERTAFEDLINMRNKCCHAAKGEISSKDYQTYKTQIENCLLALAQIYGKTHDMTLKIKDAEKRPFDESICKQLQQTILQEQVLQGVSGLHKHIESSQESEERMTIEIQELGKRTKRTFRAVNSSLKSAGHTASKIQKLAESTKRTLMVVKSSKKSVDHTATKVQKQDENTERTLQAVECSQKSIEHTAAKIQKLEENTLQAVEYTAASIEKKLEESSKRTKQVLELNHKSVEHTSAKLAKKMEENSERTIKAVESSQESTSTKIQKFEERLSKCETSKRSRLLGLTQTEINGHLKEGTFVETPAVQACIKLLETNSLLVLTGAAGTGKSRNSLEILHQFRIKHPEYETIKLTDLHDFTDIVTTEEKLVILFEDIFGRTNTRFAENTDVQIIDRIHACTIKGNIKTILTVRDTIRLSCDWLFTSHKIFHGKCEVDLSSKTFKITKPEKELLLLKYFFAHNFRLLELNEPENYFEETILDRQVTATVNRVTLHNIVETEPLLGFPEACSLFTGNRKLTRLGLSFFKHPSKYLYEEIEKLRINGSDNRQDSMTYVTLVYIFLNEDSLDPEDIDGEKCLEILESCYGISCKKIPTCQIIDAANGMLGRYLIFHFDNGTYHFQHQTIFESILISYSRIDTGLILSRLSFDFIREMVRLQNYKPREGEIVLKIIQKHYSMLANRIIEIIQSEYFSKSLSLNFQLLCESQIIRENDEYFLKILIEKAHDAYFEQDYNLQKFVTYSGKCKRCQLYLPALLLERITQQNKMDKSIALLVDHLALKLDSESEEDIEFSCKSSLLEAFLHVCELENNENILDNIWVPLKRFDASRIKRKHQKQSTFDINHILNTACEFKRLDVVQFLCTTVIGEKGNGVSIHDNIFLHELDKSQGKGTAVDQLDFTAAFIAAINNVWNDRDEPVSKWLLKNVPHQLFDMKRITMKVLEMKCMEDLKFLIQNVDNCMLDMKLVYTNQHKEGSKSIENLLRWMAVNVEQQKINILELNNLPCMTQDTEVVKYLFKNFDHSILDWTSMLLSAVNSNWRGKSKDLVEWLVLNIDLKCVNFTKVFKEVDERNEDVTKMMLEKVNHASLDMKQIMNQACRFGWLDVVTWMLHNIDHAILDIKEAMNRVPDLCGLINVQEIRGDKYNSLFKLFLEKVNHGLLDMKEIINRACRYYWLDVVTLVLDKTENHAMFDVRETISILYDECDLEYDKNKNNENNDDVYNIRNECKHLIKLFLGKVNQNLMDMKEILNRACRYGWLDVVKCVLENTNHKQLDIKEAIHIVYSSKVYDIYDNDDMKDRRDQYEPFIKLILEKVNHALLDLNDVLNQACRYCSLDVVTLVLEKNDHKKLDMKEALYIVYSLWKYDNDDEEEDENIDDRRDKYETLFKLILEKVNHDSLVLKEILNQACQYGLLGVVKLVLKNAEHKKLDLMKAINIVYNSWMLDNDDEEEDEDIHDRRDKYEPLIKLFLEKVNSDSLDLILVFNQACRYGCLDVVTLMLENNDHKTLNIMEAVNIIYSSIRDDDDDISDQRKKYEPLIKLILDKVNHDSLDFKVIMNKACRYCFLGVFTYVLENNDYDKLEIMEAVNILYSRIWNEDDDVDDIDVQREKYEPLIKLILGKVNHDLLDIKEIMNKACSYGCLDVVTFVLENIDLKECDMIESINIVSNPPCLNNMNHDSVVLEIMCKACCYGYLDVVMFALENTNHKKLDLMKAVNNAYSQFWDEDDINEIREKKEPLIKLILEKADHDLLVLKEIMNEACCYGYLDVVTFLLENTDHKKLDLMKAVNNAYSQFWDEDDINEIRKKKVHLIKLILEKADHDLLVLKEIMNEACRCGYLDVVTFLLENTDHKKLDLMKVVNNAYRSFWGEDDDEDDSNERREKKEPLIKLILEKADHDLLVLKEIMNEACCYGYLDVVTFLLENTDRKKVRFNESSKQCIQPNLGRG
ncbi:unnamed protein product [Mytilus coruscus]|uniref:Novel STAND NTPase 3 domain-containing protein n=1 Tax=Mytilus coruscus TaxID=42192 RepID=A0A6J8AFU6_MYTCO|nr:unnamed protein product [Mytilus coruscus]